MSARRPGEVGDERDARRLEPHASRRLARTAGRIGLDQSGEWNATRRGASSRARRRFEAASTPRHAARAADDEVLRAVEGRDRDTRPRGARAPRARRLRGRRRPPSLRREASRRRRRPAMRHERAASSRENTPATQAATYSPRLWPRTAAGSMPHDRQSCAARTRSRRAPAARTRSRRSASRSERREASTSSRPRSRGAANAVGTTRREPRGRPARSVEPRPIPAYCAPWPVNRNATLRALGAGHAPDATRACASPRANDRQPASEVVRVPPTTASAMGEVRAAGVGGEAHVGERGSSPRGRRLRTGSRDSAALLSSRAESARTCSGRSARWPSGIGGGRLLEDHVRVGAAEAEGADARDSAPVDRSPRRTVVGTATDSVAQAIMRVGVCEVQVRRDLAVATARGPP